MTSEGCEDGSGRRRLAQLAARDVDWGGKGALGAEEEWHSGGGNEQSDGDDDDDGRSIDGWIGWIGWAGGWMREVGVCVRVYVRACEVHAVGR